MWIVRLALDRPYTFIVLALLIVILSPVVILRTPTDIFPNINIPVIAVAWQYTGLNPEEVEGRLTSVYERILTTTVDNIEHIESTTVNGEAIVKIFLQPTASLDTANAQVAAVSQTILRQLPPGTLPPLIINYSASSVPILQLGLSGKGLSEQQLNDMGQNFIRPQLVTIPGAVIPYPYGGKQRQVMIDLNPDLLQAKGLSPQDVLNALTNQNLVLPGGTAKIDQFEYDVRVNSSPRTVAELNDLPIRQVGSSTVYLRDVANIRDGFAPQTNIVRQDGHRGVLLSILKAGTASTISVVQGIRDMLPRVAQTLPPELKIQPLADQSVFVKGAVSGVIREALIAACLTALMILLFLGSWRSTLIIAVSIPLSILTSVIILSFLGETINIMTLGGLALAVGILVDDATVTIENIERYAEQGYGKREAILEGAAQIAVPALVSTLCICIVFLPMFFLAGVSKFLFVPLAEAVVFAMGRRSPLDEASARFRQCSCGCCGTRISLALCCYFPHDGAQPSRMTPIRGGRLWGEEMYAITIPDALHCCPRCQQRIASGSDKRGRPGLCEYCERRGTTAQQRSPRLRGGSAARRPWNTVALLIALLR